MKNSSKLVILLLIFQAAWLHGQDQPKLKTYSAGLRVANFLDMPSDKFDSELSSDPSATGMDLGMDLYGEVQFNPLIGFQGGLRFGGTSGANEVEYYDNSFFEFYSDMILIISNLDRKYAHLPYNVYTKFGLGYGGFKAERYLLSDDSFNGMVKNGFLDGHIGAGLQYEFSRYLRFEFDASYNVALDDGFDGFNYGTGNDPYFSTGIGVAYTFGDREEEIPMYSVGLFSEEYAGMSTDNKKVEAEKDSLSNYVAGLSQSLTELKKNVEMLSEKVVEQKSTIAEQKKTNEAQQKEIDDLKAAAQNTQAQAAAQPVTYWERELKQVQVYFDFDSDALTPATTQILSEALRQGFEEISITGYASSEGDPEYNDQLKKRRVEQVKSYLLNELKIDPSQIVETKVAEDEDPQQEDYLNRKVVVRY